MLGIPSKEIKHTLANADRTMAGVDQVVMEAAATLAVIRRIAEHVEAIAAVFRKAVEKP